MGRMPKSGPPVSPSARLDTGLASPSSRCLDIGLTFKDESKMTQLVTIEQAAELLACTPAAIRKWLYQRRLTPVKIGSLTRLRLADVERIINSGLPESGRSRT